MSMSEYSLSDIAAASGESGFGGNNAWWVIILFAMIFGWGGNALQIARGLVSVRHRTGYSPLSIASLKCFIAASNSSRVTYCCAGSGLSSTG